MFGLFKSKTEKMVMKLERQIMAVEHFYDRGKYDVARQAVYEQLQTLKWLHQNGDWSEDKINRYLFDRGLVRSARDAKYQDEITSKLMVLT
jgi:hypothetical protein